MNFWYPLLVLDTSDSETLKSVFHSSFLVILLEDILNENLDWV